MQLGETAEATRRAAYGGASPPARRTLLVGDATTLFWTETPTQAEALYAAFLDYKEEGEAAHDGADP